MLRPRWRKVLRDMWDFKGRTILVVLAIAVGVQGFGGTFITQNALITNMNAGYASINPSSVTMNTSYLDEGAIQAIQDMREVGIAEGRSSFSVKLKVGPDKWLNLTLIAVKDYERLQLDRITPEEGAWPPGRRQVLFERTSAPLTGAQIGDTVLIELPDGQTRELNFAGTVHDFNAIPAGVFPFLSGYVSRKTLEWLGQPSLYSELHFTVAENGSDRSHIEAVAALVQKRLESMGYQVFFTSIPDPGEHWASDTTRAFTAVLSGIGLFGLLLSGFLVVNTISAILAQQVRQIGMMKAVGARTSQVTWIYLVMVAAFGLLGFLIAVPVGTGSAWLNAQPVASFLNIDIVDFYFPPWVLGLQAATAILVPMLAALIPVLIGTHITVREAVSDYGIGQPKAQVGWFDRLLEKVRGLPRPTLLSLRNTFRRKGRLFLTLGTLMLAGAIFIAVLNVRGSLLIELDKILQLFKYDIQISLGGLYRVNQLEREALRVPGVTSLEGWAAAQVQRVRPDGSEGTSITLFGPPAETSFINPILLEGRWLYPRERDAIVLSVDVLRLEPDVKLGDPITLQIGSDEHTFRVVGIIDRVGQNFAYTDFYHLSRIQGAPGFAGVLMVGTEQHDAAFQSAVARALEERFKRSGIQVSGTLTTETIVGASVQQFNFLIGFMLFAAVMLAAVGGLGLAGTMSLNVLERTREIGVLRAIGASDGSLRGIVVTEGLIIGLISWLLGSLFSVPLSLGLNLAVGQAFFERPLLFSFESMGPILWLVLALFLSAIASLLPAHRASRISVREALAYE